MYDSLVCIFNWNNSWRRNWYKINKNEIPHKTSFLKTSIRYLKMVVLNDSLSLICSNIWYFVFKIIAEISLLLQKRKTFWTFAKIYGHFGLMSHKYSMIVDKNLKHGLSSGLGKRSATYKKRNIMSNYFVKDTRPENFWGKTLIIRKYSYDINSAYFFSELS